MMPKQDLLPFLTNTAGNSYRVNNGLVGDTSTPTPLPHSPDGWQDTEINWERNIRYSGVFRSFTTPLKFVREGMRIIKNRVYRFGPEDKIYLLINWLDKTFGGGWVHRSFYKGELDLSQMEDDDDGRVITVPIMEGDLIKLYKAYENTTYEVPITGPLVRMDGLELANTSSYTTIDAQQVIFDAEGPSPTKFDLLWIPIQFINNDGANIDAEQQSTSPLVEFSSVGPYDDNRFLDNWFYHATGNKQVKLNFPVTMTMVNGTSLELYLKNSNGSRISIGTITNPIPAHLAYTETKTINVNLTLNLLADEKLYLISQLRFDRGSSPGAPNAGLGKYGETNIQISATDRYKATYVKTVRPLALGQALLDKITGGGGYTFSSNYLSNNWENLVVTSGDGLRGLNGAVIKTSISDYFDSYNTVLNMELTMAGKVLSMEPKASAFDQTVALAMGPVKSFKRSFAKDYQYNALSIGYPVGETTTYESLNGRGAFNATSEYTSVVTRNPKKLEILSKYKASMGEEELIRINLDGKTTTDSSTDNDVYFLHIEKTSAGTTTTGIPYFNLYRAPYDSITGLISPATAFNIELSPARCLRRHGNYLRSIFYWQQATKLVFQTSAKNTEMITVKNGVTFQENADVIIGTLDPPLFIPLSLAFTSPINRQIVNVMKNNPNQSFSFVDDDGDTHYGFPMSVKLKPANQPAQDTVLLCSPLTDITKFID